MVVESSDKMPNMLCCKNLLQSKDQEKSKYDEVFSSIHMCAECTTHSTIRGAFGFQAQQK